MDRMKGLQQTVFKLLAVLILIGAMAGARISWQRYHVEAAAQTVEMVYDYNNILDSAAVERTTTDALFELYRKNGVTSLAVYDETPEKLVNHNFIRVYRGYEFQARHPEISGILPDKIYIQPVDTADGNTYFKEMADHLSLLYSRDEVKAISENGVEALEVSGVYDKFMTMPLGIFTNTVKRAGSHGFYVVLRPANVAHAPKAFINDFFQAVDASDKVSGVIFQGKEVFGYKEYQKEVSQGLNQRRIPIVMIEAQSQLGFEPQAGLLDMARHSDYHLVRLYAMSKDELIKLNQKEAAARFYI